MLFTVTIRKPEETIGVVGSWSSSMNSDLFLQMFCVQYRYFYRSQMVSKDRSDREQYSDVGYSWKKSQGELLESFFCQTKKKFIDEIKKIVFCRSFKDDEENETKVTLSVDLNHSRFDFVLIIGQISIGNAVHVQQIASKRPISCDKSVIICR